LYKATDSMSLERQQYVLRAAAIPIGLLVVWLTYLMAGLLFPGDRLMLMVAPTFVAFQTQFSYESAMVNNDIMLIAAPLIALAIIFGVGIRHVRRWITLGAVTVTVAALVCWPWYAFLYRTY